MANSWIARRIVDLPRNGTRSPQRSSEAICLDGHAALSEVCSGHQLGSARSLHMLSLFEPRNPRTFLLDMMPPAGRCAEIGVWKGDFSAQILSKTRPIELHLIDPWKFSPAFPKRWYGGSLASSQADMDSICDGVKARFSHSACVHIHRQASLGAARDFANGHFDWIYIDGDHSYQAVLDDLEAWKSKVRAGGYLCGDDYNWRDEAGIRSVKRAVDEFAARYAISHLIVRNKQFIAQLP